MENKEELEHKIDEIEFEDKKDTDENNEDEEDSDNSLWMLKIERREGAFGILDLSKTFEKVFSTKELAEKWLILQGFVFGKPKMIVWSDSMWFHQEDNETDINFVELRKIHIDDFKEKSWVDTLFFRHIKDKSFLKRENILE